MRGKLALAGFNDSRADAGSWLDAVYAIVADAPHEVIKEMYKQITLAGARIAPDRDTWGLLPEHQAIAGGMKPGDDQAVPPMPRGDRRE